MPAEWYGSAEWMKIASLAIYLDMSDRSVRKLLKCGLRHVRLPSGTIRVKRQWADEFLENYTVDIKSESATVDQFVEDIMNEL